MYSSMVDNSLIFRKRLLRAPERHEVRKQRNTLIPPLTVSFSCIPCWTGERLLIVQVRLMRLAKDASWNYFFIKREKSVLRQLLRESSIKTCSKFNIATPFCALSYQNMFQIQHSNTFLCAFLSEHVPIPILRQLLRLLSHKTCSNTDIVTTFKATVS